jgi:hypothetical protein
MFLKRFGASKLPILPERNSLQISRHFHGFSIPFFCQASAELVFHLTYRRVEESDKGDAMANEISVHGSVVKSGLLSNSEGRIYLPAHYGQVETDVDRDFVLRNTNARDEVLQTPSAEQYPVFDFAYKHFNETLFDGGLPDVMLTLRQRGARCLGYYVPSAFEACGDQPRLAAEIALNPMFFRGPLKAVLAVLVHQMVHHRQHQEKNASRPTYHDRRWAELMKVVGLHPSHTGEPDGKETGQQMSQYIVAGGAFEVACDDLIETGFRIKWVEAIKDFPAEPKEVSARAPLKVTWICPKCNDAAMAKRTACFACIRCGVPLILQADLQAADMEAAPVVKT